MKEPKKIELKPILIVSATRLKNYKDTRLYSCSKALDGQVEFKFKTENDKGLPKIYNNYFTKKIAEKHDIVLFCHDDLYIDDNKLRGKLYKSMYVDKYDIVGLAGASTCKISDNTPTLWHLMSDRESWSGTVFHPYGNNTKQVMSTTYGPTPKRCLVLDGLFLAVNIKRARECKWRFNEQFNFHHYDIASCLDANSKKMKLGTSMIHAVHDSPGLTSTSDKDWQESQSKFIELYS